MWHTDSLWFEIAIVSIIFAAGNILFGLFEERTPRARKLIKYLVTTGIVLLISIYAGRSVAMILLALFFIPVIYIHGFYLPRKGINGWTGEPKSKYYEFRKWDKDIFKDPRR
jgi:ABC-type multidrug transport system permease subunit